MNWKWPLIWSGERGGWWRVPVTCVLFGGCFFILGFILIKVLQEWGLQDDVKGRSAGLKAGVDMFVLVSPLCFSGIGCLLGIKFVHHKPMRCVFTDGRPFRFGLFFQSCAVWGALWLPGVLLFPGVLRDLNDRFHEIRPSSWPGACLALFSVITLQAAATEEILDRGYLQTRIAAWVKRPWLAVCISTVIITLLHSGKMTVPAHVRIALIGCVLGIALIRANTIAPLIGMQRHA